MKNNYFPTVDFMRLFAALWVVSVHYFGETGGGNTLFKYGNLGVPLFFIISGFVISFSIQGKSLREFAIARFFRLYPLFWFACIVTFLLTLIVPHGDPVSLKDFILNLPMLGTKGGASRLIDPSYWSLAVEIAFYVGIGLFVALFSFARVRWFYVSWLLVSFLIFLFDVQRNIFAEFTLARHAPYFIFGGFFALLIQNFSTSTYYQKVKDSLGMFFAACLAFYVMNYSLVPAYAIKDPKDIYFISLANILFFIGIPFIVYFSRAVTNTKVIRYATIAGGITYPLYLLHQKIGELIVHALGVGRTFSYISIATAIMMIIVSYYVYLFDTRFRKYCMRKLSLKKE